MTARSVAPEAPLLQSLHDLKAGSRRHLLAGLLLGSQGWVGAFLVLAALIPLLRVPPVEVPLPPVDPHFVERTPMLPDLDLPQAPPVKPPVSEFAPPVPVADDVAPPVETQSERQSAPPMTGLDGTGEKEPMGDSRAVLPAPPPPPGTYINRDEDPVLVTVLKPEYPDLAREAGVEGTVLLWVWVEPSGRVGKVAVMRSIPMLDEAAARAARQWVFTPALLGNQPVAVWVAVPVRFTLH